MGAIFTLLRQNSRGGSLSLSLSLSLFPGVNFRFLRPNQAVKSANFFEERERKRERREKKTKRVSGASLLRNCRFRSLAFTAVVVVAVVVG